MSLRPKTKEKLTPLPGCKYFDPSFRQEEREKIKLERDNMNREQMLQHIHDKMRNCHDSTEASRVVDELAKEFLADPNKLHTLLTSNVVTLETQQVMGAIRIREALANDRKKETKPNIQQLTVDQEGFGVIDFPPIATQEETKAIQDLYDNDPNLNGCDAWIQTYKGHKFFPQYPDKSVIDIEDIAHSLANQCRFGGHPTNHYSVAQHCILVSYLCKSEHALWGLLHDAEEFALPDMPSPIKRLPELAGYRQLATKVQKAIMKRFDLPEQEPVDVKQADLMVLGIEAQTFMSPSHPDWKMPVEPPPYLIIKPMSPQEAKACFLARFHQLTGYKHQYGQPQK